MAMVATSFVEMPFQIDDNMQPLKVPLPSGVEPCSYLASAPGMMWQDPCCAPHLNAHEWEDAVKVVAPFLNVEGMKRALCILDCAVANVQKTHAMEQTRLLAGMGIGVAAIRERVAACALLESQLKEQQGVLWHELQQLPFQDGMFCPYDQASLAAFSPPSIAPLVAPPGLEATPDAASTAATSVEALAASISRRPPVRPPQNEAIAGNALHRRRAPQTLSTSLRILEDEDADCLLIVRRISKLGFKAARSLKQHFSNYGLVVKVLLAHSTARQYNDQQIQVKRRPSNLGFVQMATSEAAKLVLAQGAVQEIDGFEVSVQRFEHHEEMGMQASLAGQATSPGAPQKVIVSPADAMFERQLSEASTAATRESLTGSSQDESGEFSD